MRNRWKPMLTAALVVGLTACSGAASAPVPAGTSQNHGSPSQARASSFATSTVLPTGSAAVTVPVPAITPAPATAAAPTVGNVKGIDVCSRLSRAEVGSAIGTTVKPGETMTLTTETAGCQWDAADNSLTFLQVYVAAYTQEQWDIDLAKPGTETVPGVGDAAIRTEVGLMGPAGTLVIRKGALRIDLEIYTETGKKAAVEAQGIKLANLILPRL